MKEIKFRAWEKCFDDDGENYYCMTNNIPHWAILGSDTSNKYIVMQYIGFQDKNGIDIFEGDILEVAGGSKITVNELSEFLIYCGKYEEKHGVELFHSISVIGNIYEKSE